MRFNRMRLLRHQQRLFQATLRSSSEASVVFNSRYIVVPRRQLQKQIGEQRTDDHALRRTAVALLTTVRGRSNPE